jgi:hypothetical protein
MRDLLFVCESDSIFFSETVGNKLPLFTFLNFRNWGVLGWFVPSIVLLAPWQRFFWPDMNSEHDWVLTNVWCVHLCFAHPGVDKPAFILVQGSSLIVAVCVTIVAVCLMYEIPCFILASLSSDVFHVEVKASMLVLPLQSFFFFWYQLWARSAWQTDSIYLPSLKCCWA